MIKFWQISNLRSATIWLCEANRLASCRQVQRNLLANIWQVQKCDCATIWPVSQGQSSRAWQPPGNYPATIPGAGKFPATFQRIKTQGKLCLSTSAYRWNYVEIRLGGRFMVDLGLRTYFVSITNDFETNYLISLR